MTNSQLNNRISTANSKFLSAFLFVIFYCFSFIVVEAQVIPRAKTKAEKKAERKGMTLAEKIESIAPVDVMLPSAKVNLPGDNDISSVEDAKKFVSETLPDIGIKVKRKAKKTKELAKSAVNLFDGKKYDGIAVDKQVVRKGSGNRMRYTELYTSKKNDQSPDPYVKSVFWFEQKRQRVVEALARNREANLLMHGPYKEYRGETLVEEGYYYLGTKHGRWVTYDGNGDVLSKSTYSKGFLGNSTITYYGTDSTKIKEVIPNWYGKQTGDYFIFHEAGTLAIQGQLDNGVKIGKWIEYYPTGNRRKKETQHGGDCFDDMEPYVIREYDESGKMTYQKK
jgi:antitoxin component YwqK of YwqJK toxin-antitoxin module